MYMLSESGINMSLATIFKS